MQLPPFTMRACKVSSSSTAPRRTWEEDMYWTNFRSIHFCQFLRGDFHRRLAIPKKFAENIGKNLHETVLIKGPSGETWDVGLVAEDDDLFFKSGWEDFVETYRLEEDDLLMFKYNGESSFNVLMFNSSSLCEKEASYFQRKRERGVAGKGDQSGAKRKRKGDDLRTARLESNDMCISKEDTGKDDGVAAIPRATGAANGSAIVSHKARPRKEKLRHSMIKTPKKEPVAAISWITSDELMQESIRKSPSNYPIYQSNRRPVTAEEVSSAYTRAIDAVTSDGFLVVMRPTHVYKRFYLSVPIEWACKYLGNQTQDIVLRLDEKTWNTKYTVTGRGTGGFSNGWKAFSMDNHLEESDVCVFDLAKTINEIVVLDVTIFRVVNDIVPLTAPH
ncbi:hypothetical protein MLD38_001779 [Melastoma candidum]|uniref:Uncharacterized protein n=1 Tax=Melastoma candidum TaxID=119954 RepID=A0ACB9SEF3_9MYRT|nr:hypothetical protein MLD38_001779 [Melastoma candidum]